MDYRKASDLPLVIPVFPLPGAVLFPRWELPLNIFEPRYLNMVDDAMRGDRIIGMVQTSGGARAHPDLAAVGCAGRVTSYSETTDGRYLITLRGICRFEITRESAVSTPYRQVEADWSGYIGDLMPEADSASALRAALTNAFSSYAQVHRIDADWTAMQSASFEMLVHALASGCPFSPAEKQALLEAGTLEQRARALMALLEFGSRPGGAGAVQ